ncbi:MAG: glycosyltransferase family 39 protein [Gemmatimonadota bacterium]|nr:glycosyltransferase family 39 protein [Gemmatimonadota bacterium]
MTEPLNAPTEPRSRVPDRVFLLAMLLGVGGRFAHFLSGRSLWLDEAMIALNIDQRSFSELSAALDFNQAAPLGFLWLEKLAVLPFGTSELALRFWPFVAGLAALAVFAVLARRLLSPGAAVFAFTLFALSTSLTYYSAEVKQYSFDVLLACLLPLLGLMADEDDRSAAWIALALAGALGVWFSHPLVFVLPGVVLFLSLTPVDLAIDPAVAPTEERRVFSGFALRGDRLRRLAAVGALWGVSFAVAYWLTARDVSRSPLMARFWVEGFMPLPPTSVADLGWYAHAFTGWIRGVFDFTETDSPLRTAAFWIGGVVAMAGGVVAWGRDRRRYVLVAMPVLLALLAAAIRLYPFKGRLILFLVPATIVLIAWGLEAAVSSRPVAGGTPADAPPGPARAVARLGGFAAGTLLVVCSSVILAQWLAQPGREELRPVLQHVVANAEPGDVIYLHSGAQHAYLFYERTCESCRVEPGSIVRGGFLSGQDEAIARDLSQLPRTGRVWLVFAHEWWGYGRIERDRMIAALETRSPGGSAEVVEETGAAAILFDLGTP